ncbi:MAG: hypothetical protein HRU40_18760, partial [Saprospiraceae bacterium]|nr:hypothetical protein [Saprospiraceae bacterium]
MNILPAVRPILFLSVLLIFGINAQAQRTDLKDAVSMAKTKNKQGERSRAYQLLDSIFRVPEVAQDNSFGEAKWLYGMLLSIDAKFQASIDTFSQLYQWAQNRNDTAYMSDALIETGFCYLELNNLDSALWYGQRALRLLKGSKLRGRLQTSLLTLADIHIKRYDFYSATEMILEIIQIAEKEENLESLTDGYDRLGRIYTQQKALLKADSTYQIGLHYARKQKNRRQIVPILNSYGILKKERGQYDQAAVMYEEAYQIADSLGYITPKISISCNQVSLAYEQGKYQDAAFYLQRSRNLLQTIPSPLSRQLNEIQLLGAKLVYQAGNFRQALDSVNVALRNSREIDETDKYLDGLKTKVDILKGMGQYRGALTLFEEYTILKDSLKADKTTLQIAQLEASFLKEKQARQIQEQ